MRALKQIKKILRKKPHTLRYHIYALKDFGAGHTPLYVGESTVDALDVYQGCPRPKSPNSLSYGIGVVSLTKNLAWVITPEMLEELIRWEKETK